MTTLILQTTPFIEMIVPKMQAIYLRCLHALDAFAEARMRNAVPERELRRAQRELGRCRRLVRHGDVPQHGVKPHRSALRHPAPATQMRGTR